MNPLSGESFDTVPYIGCNPMSISSCILSVLGVVRRNTVRSMIAEESFAFVCILDWCMHPVLQRGKYYMLTTKATFRRRNDFRAVSLGHIRRQPKEGRDNAVLCGWQAPKPVRILFGCILLYFTDFSDFSNFAYRFMRIPNLYYL